MATPAFTQGGKVVGLLKNGDLYKKVRKSLHLFRKVGANGGWGLDYDVLFKTLSERANVYVQDEEENITYQSTAAQWRECGEIMHFKSKYDDHYTQVFLPLEYFSKKKEKDAIQKEM